jgi:hypothetical protein
VYRRKSLQQRIIPSFLTATILDGSSNVAATHIRTETDLCLVTRLSLMQLVQQSTMVLPIQLSLRTLPAFCPSARSVLTMVCCNFSLPNMVINIPWQDIAIDGIVTLLTVEITSSAPVSIYLSPPHFLKLILCTLCSICACIA